VGPDGVGIDTLLRGVSGVDGVLMACVVDPATGMVVGTAGHRDEAGTAMAAAGAADVLQVLAVMTANLALGGEVEDAVITLTKHFHILRVLPVGPDQGLLLLVTLDRTRANLAMAQREIRGLRVGG
jgi:hypothetical protein